MLHVSAQPKHPRQPSIHLFRVPLAPVSCSSSSCLLFSQVWFQAFPKFPLRCPLRYIYSDVTLPTNQPSRQCVCILRKSRIVPSRTAAFVALLNATTQKVQDATTQKVQALLNATTQNIQDVVASRTAAFVALLNAIALLLAAARSLSPLMRSAEAGSARCACVP